MAGPIQHHFLPERSYLKHFEIPENPNFIFQYQTCKRCRCLHLTFVRTRGGKQSLQNDRVDGAARTRTLLQFLNILRQETNIGFMHVNLTLQFLYPS